jgi:hypothetical protein
MGFWQSTCTSWEIQHRFRIGDRQQQKEDDRENDQAIEQNHFISLHLPEIDGEQGSTMCGRSRDRDRPLLPETGQFDGNDADPPQSGSLLAKLGA